MEEEKPFQENNPEKDNKQNTSVNNLQQEEVSSAAAIALPEAEQPTINNPSTEQDMEVHHHTHAVHGKKNRKSYFRELFIYRVYI